MLLVVRAAATCVNFDNLLNYSSTEFIVIRFFFGKKTYFFDPLDWDGVELVDAGRREEGQEVGRSMRGGELVGELEVRKKYEEWQVLVRKGKC